MQKYRMSDVKSFEFSDLKGTPVVTQMDYKSFEFKSLTDDVVNDHASDEEIRNERKFAQKNNFKIDEVVRDGRGLLRQEQSDLEQTIQQEVKRRLDVNYDAAYKEGLDKGAAEGKEIAAKEFHEAMGGKVAEFEKIITEIQSQSGNIMEKNRHEVHEFVKRFTKWIVLKEINEKVYLESLLEKLILELNARKNLIVKVGRANFAQMPEVIATVESRLGQLSNVRIEIVPEISYPGIILETENGLIDGSMESVFQNIDKIFAQVAKHE